VLAESAGKGYAVLKGAVAADEGELVPDAGVEHAVASERGGAFLLTLMQYPS